MKTLTLNKISKSYNKRSIIHNISFNITQGEVIGLLGPNGAGKTTTFYITVGLVRPSSGNIYFQDENITSLAMYKRANIGIGYLPQEASIFRKLSVEENILAVLEHKEKSTIKRKKRCITLLKQFNVQHIRKQKGHTLSGGERRRVEIARAIACDPKILLLDEPFAGVDPLAIKDIQNIIQQIKKMNIGVLITDHNVRETLKIVDKAYIISDGNILIHGTAKELIKSKKAKQIYLGEDFKL